MIKKIATGVGILVSICILIGTGIQVDQRFAKAQEVRTLELRLEQKIQQDRAFALQERMWNLEDRYGKIEDMPEDIRDSNRRSLKSYDEIQKMLDKILLDLPCTSRNTGE